MLACFETAGYSGVMIPWRFIRKTSGCWVWTASTDRWGYGKFAVGGRSRVAHRYVWEQLVGPIPSGKFLCHHCDNRRCVKPAHLYVGDERTNAADAVRRGRSTRGVKNPSAKLSEKQVLALVKDSATMSQKALSIKYEISTMQVHRILNGDRWGHLTGLTRV